MGWTSEVPAHEGWPIALHRDEKHALVHNEYLRELAYPADEAAGLRVDAVQAGCDCGWRSERFPTAAGVVQWFPFSPDVPEFIEGKLREQFQAHVAEVAARKERR